VSSPVTYQKSEYTSEQITVDAVEFANSRFGQHYTARLVKAQQRARDDAENLELTDSYRANRASQAAAIQAELHYFETARTVASNPDYMARLRKAVTKKEKQPDIAL
jgi:hypothetical protein